MRRAHYLSSYRRLAEPMTSFGWPSKITCPFLPRVRVAQRAIRLSRLSAALISCANERRTDDLTSLLVEASRVAGGNERSDTFLQDHPDLVAIADDNEAFRRLLEIRTSWPGRRHASLSIAFALTDEIDEARRNAWRAFDWLHWRATQTEEPGDRKLPAVGDLDRIGPAYWALLGGKRLSTGISVFLSRCSVEQLSRGARFPILPHRRGRFDKTHERHFLLGSERRCATRRILR
jgi:hypothetical protein